MEGWPTISDDPDVQAHYERCRGNGCGHGLAEVLALKAFPGVAGTDSVFLQGRQFGGGQFAGNAEMVGRHHLEQAERAGVNPAGKFYMGGLARFPGDPRAWVSGRGDVKAICEAEGWDCRGAVNVRGRTPEGPADGPYRVAPDIVAEATARRLAEEPTLKRDEVRAQEAERLAGIHGRRPGG